MSNIYDAICRDVVSSSVNGRINGVVLAYGKTGSGKTHTTKGRSGGEHGIIKMTAQDIFCRINGGQDPELPRAESEDGVVPVTILPMSAVRVSSMDIYN